MVPWETCVDGMFGPQFIDAVRKMDAPVARVFAGAMEFPLRWSRTRTGQEGVVLCDLFAACTAIDSSVILEFERAFVYLQTAGLFSRGFTVVDARSDSDFEPNVLLCRKYDQEKVSSMFLAALRRTRAKDAG